MRLSKFSKKVIAYLCAIAMVVSSFVFTPSNNTAADTDPSTLDYTMVESGGNTIGYNIVSNTIDGAVAPWYGDGGATFQMVYSGDNLAADTTVKINGEETAPGGVVNLIANGLTKLNPIQMDDDAYTHIEITTTTGAADLYIKKGNPGGPTQETTEEPDERELLTPFDEGWNTPDGATVTADEAVVEVPAKTGGDNWSTQLVKNGLRLTNGKWYKATVTINSTVARKFQLLIQSDGQQGGNWSLMNPDNNLFEVEANEDYTFTYTFQASGVVNNYLFGVMMGYIDDTPSDACTVTVTDASLIQYKDAPVEPTTEEPTEETTVEPTTEAPTVEPTTEEPTEEPTTEEPTTKEQKPQDYYDGWVDTERNLALKGTASDTGAHREGSIKQINDAVIDKFDNWDAITVNEEYESGSFNIKLDKAYDAASIDQIVVYWRTADVQFVPQAGYKVQFGYNGVFTTVATLTHDDYPTEGTVGGWPDVTDECRFVTDSDFTTDRLESKGVDTIRILVDTPVEWGAQVREICVFSENPQDAPPLPQADDPDDITASSPDYGTIAYTVTPGEGQENYKYNVYAGEELIGEGLDGNQEYIAYGFDPGDYTLRAVSVVEGMDPSDGIYSDTVTVADPIELIASTKNKAPEGEIISVSSFYNENYDLDTSQCAIDGTPVVGEGNTDCLRTGANQQPATIDIDLGKQYNKKDLQGIVLAYTNPRTYAADTVVGVSNDGETYYSVADQRGFSVKKDGQLTANLISTDVIDDEGTFRYVRINLSSGVNDWGYVVNQIGVIIDDGEEPTTEEPTTEEPTTEAPTEAPTQVPGEWKTLTPENFVVTEEIVEEGQVTGRWFQVSGYEVYLGYWDNASGQAMIDADDQDNIKFQQLSSNWYGEWGTQVRKTLTGLIPGEEYTLTMNMNASAADGTYKTSQDDTSYPVQEGDQTITIKGKADQDGNISFTVGTGLVGTAVVMTFSDVVVKDDMGYQVYPKVEPTTEAPTETQTEQPSTEAPTETQKPTETQTAKPTETAKPGPGPATTAKPTVKPTAKPKPAKPGKTKVKKAVKKKKSAKKIKVKLKKVKGAKGYQVAVYKSKKKAKKNKKALVKKYYKKTKFTIKSKKFKNKKKLWVKARAFVMYGKSKIFGKWSKPKKTKKK